MNHKQLLSAALFFISCALFAQNKQFTLEEIWSGAFRTSFLDDIHSMKDGQHYTVYNFDRQTRTTSIDKYSYKTSQKVGTLVSSADIDALRYFQGYSFNNDESKILLSTDVSPIYRRSTLARYYIYDIATKKVEEVDGGEIQEPLLSPDNKKIAYVKERNIIIKNLGEEDGYEITTDGGDRGIINGVTDWVYEEEFAFVRAFDWNKDGTKLAYIRFDEANVNEFSMDVYGEELYQTQQKFKYPKAGEDNAEVSLHIYDLNTKQTATINLGDYEDFYIPRIAWTTASNTLSVQVLNRHQNKLDLIFVDASTNKAKVVMTDTDPAYVDVTDNLTFLEDNSFIWTSEKDGYNHIYHYASDGKLKRQITTGDWEVTTYYGFDKKNQTIYYQSVENGSTNRDVYSIKINGKAKKRLTNKTGTNSASFSANYSYFINTFSSATTPYEFTLHEAKDGKELKRLKDNKELSDILKKYAFTAKEFSTIKVNGNDLNMWMIKPKNFDPNKTYPVLMYQYSGPGSQSVANSWNSANDYWYYMLAQQGYIVACVDGRGTGFKGSAFKKVTYLNLVGLETEDQIAAAKQLGKLPYVDANRIGIWGWSFGGHMSTNCLLKGNDVFSTAIAVAPVTSWRFYDTIYTERYLRTPQENPKGYDDNSPFNYPELLKGKYLLVHGSADDNVHVQNAMRMAEALIQANKPFDFAIYPDKNHGIYGGNTRLHLYNKMTNFIKENL
jgi:dipeptidyl-peptidase-4